MVAVSKEWLNDSDKNLKDLSVQKIMPLKAYDSLESGRVLESQMCLEESKTLL